LEKKDSIRVSLSNAQVFPSRHKNYLCAMLIKTRGIVLHTLKYGETSIITRIFTERSGLQSFIVNGVRSARAKGKASYFNPGNLLDMDLYQRDNKQLLRIKEYKFTHIYTAIPFDMVKSGISMFLVELLNHSIKEHESNEALFQFIFDQFVFLDAAEKKSDAKFHIWFMLQLTSYLGFLPELPEAEEHLQLDLSEGIFRKAFEEEKWVLSESLSQYWAILQSLEREQLAQVEIPKSVREALLQQMEVYYSLHLEGFKSLQSPRILREVMD